MQLIRTIYSEQFFFFFLVFCLHPYQILKSTSVLYYGWNYQVDGPINPFIFCIIPIILLPGPLPRPKIIIPSHYLLVKIDVSIITRSTNKFVHGLQIKYKKSSQWLLKLQNSSEIICTQAQQSFNHCRCTSCITLQCSKCLRSSIMLNQDMPSAECCFSYRLILISKTCERRSHSIT